MQAEIPFGKDITKLKINDIDNEKDMVYHKNVYVNDYKNY